MAPRPAAEADRPDPLSAEDRAWYATMPPPDLASAYDGRFVADEVAAEALRKSRERTRAIGAILLGRMRAAGVASVVVARRRAWVRLEPHDDGRGFRRTKVERSGGAT